MILVVIDPSVFVSALIGQPGSAPDLLVEALAEDEIEAIVSPALLAELRRVLARPKFRRYADQQAVDEYVARISRHVRHVDDPSELPAITRDPDDDYLVALGRREDVDAIVSVDLDLLDAGIDAPVVRTPRQIVDSLSSS